VSAAKFHTHTKQGRPQMTISHAHCMPEATNTQTVRLCNTHYNDGCTNAPQCLSCFFLTYPEICKTVYRRMFLCALIRCCFVPTDCTCPAGDGFSVLRTSCASFIAHTNLLVTVDSSVSSVCMGNRKIHKLLSLWI
jgi:hypothetical protein